MLIGYTTNLGLGRMAEVRGISYDLLIWTAANVALVNCYHRLPLTQTFGGGIRQT